MEESETVIKKVILISVIFLVLLLTYLILMGASKITDKLGETGNKVMMRLMGLIVMVIAVEFFFSGLKPIVISILNG